MELEQFRGRHPRALTNPEDSISQEVRRPAAGVAQDDRIGETAEIFDQGDPKGDRERPKLANCECVHLLIGGDVPTQCLGIKAAIAMGDKGPGNAEDAGISDEWAVGQFGELAIIPRWQICPDIVNLPFDKVVIVKQPRRGRRNRAAIIRHPQDRMMGV